MDFEETIRELLVSTFTMRDSEQRAEIFRQVAGVTTGRLTQCLSLK